MLSGSPLSFFASCAACRPSHMFIAIAVAISQGTFSSLDASVESSRLSDSPWM
jgi:hypothetical protein